MKNKKIWAIFSGLGFALLTSSLIDAVRIKPNFANLVAFIGLVISIIGITTILNSILWLSVKKGSLSLKNEGVYKIVGTLCI